MNKTNELGTESVGKLLLKFSIPSVIGMMVNMLYNIVDRIFVGRGVGSIALSGVAVTFPIVNVIMGFAMLAGIGAAAVISIKLGQHKKEDAEKVLGNAFTLLVIFSLCITIFGITFLDPILKVLGASSETLSYARDFSFIILLGVILQSVSMGLNNIIRAEGNPKIAMLTMLIGAVLNFIANPIFIFVLHLGVKGSALATIVSQSITVIWTLQYFTGGKSLLKLTKKNMKLDKIVVKEIVSIGMSPFAMQMAASLVTITFNKSLAIYGGDIAIGAFSLITSVTMLILMPIFGINQGAQPIIGYNYGDKQYDRVKKTVFYASVAATVITTLGFIVVQLFPVQIISIFNTSDQRLISIGAKGLRIDLLFFPIVGSSIVCTNYFQAIAKAKLSTILSLLRQVIMIIPLLIILPPFFKLDGVWMAQPIADVLSTVITLILAVKQMKTLGHSHKMTENRAVSDTIQ
ncbi:MATE family efflux transporter [Clostridium sp. P21]|uniref:Multidrug export protein MepA n=1 Tax=Clostridium muellerianum TaxID=2716538 RepID=A0A7Y0EGE5_9CLOT|nr:MATE family efflux transporter [Clostridium muellerianum]NMM62948.1 MATE family efflux transporter [Clostridium muellerianum]